MVENIIGMLTEIKKEWKKKMYKDYIYKKNILSEVQIEITRRCNWNCDFCYLGEDRNTELHFEDLKRIFKEMKELGCIKIIFTGGEPLVHKDAMNIFREAKKMGFICKINTNASMINKDNVEEISEIFSEFFVSIHSDIEDIHDNLTKRKGSLEATINGVRLLKSKEARVRINTVLTKVSISRFDTIRNFVENDLKCQWNPETRIDSTLDGNPEKANKHRIEENELKQVLKKVNMYKFVEENSYSTGVCLAGRKNCFIDADGNLYPCLQFKNKQGYKAQNILRKSLTEIWFHDEILNKIREIKKEDFYKCLSCINYKKCYKCIANNYISTNDFICPSDEICKREMFYANYSTYNN